MRDDESTPGRGGETNDDAADVNDEQAAALQDRDEPGAVFDFGTAYSADPGDARDQADAPQTREPDTSLGHEGGQRYEDYAGDED